jgi:diaphanous 1
LLHTAVDEIMTCENLRAVLGVILDVGNKMNEGTYRGGAQGFTLDSLLKLTLTKSTANKRLTLLDYIVTSVLSKTPHLLDWPVDLKHLDKAVRIKDVELFSSVKKLELRLESLEREVILEVCMCMCIFPLANSCTVTCLI